MEKIGRNFSSPNTFHPFSPSNSLFTSSATNKTEKIQLKNNSMFKTKNDKMICAKNENSIQFYCTNLKSIILSHSVKTYMKNGMKDSSTERKLYSLIKKDDICAHLRTNFIAPLLLLLIVMYTMVFDINSNHLDCSINLFP